MTSHTYKMAAVLETSSVVCVLCFRYQSERTEYRESDEVRDFLFSKY